jgi:hypothetical protein
MTVMPNKPPEPTAVGACSSAVAVHVASRRWLSFLRWGHTTLMTFRTTLMLALALTSCAQPAAIVPSSAQAGRDYPRPSNRSVAEFTFIGPSTTVEAAMARLGPPDANACVSSGYHNALIYILGDSTSITIDTDGGSRILDVQHGQTVLFEQAR